MSPGEEGASSPIHGRCRPPKRVPGPSPSTPHRAHAELCTEERRRAVPMMPSVRPSAPQAPRRCCCPRTPSWRRPRRRATACSVRSCSASTSPRCATMTCTAGALRAARTSPRSCARGVSGARPRGSQSTRPAPGGLSTPAPRGPQGPLSTPDSLGASDLEAAGAWGGVPCDPSLLPRVDGGPAAPRVSRAPTPSSPRLLSAAPAPPACSARVLPGG